MPTFYFDEDVRSEFSAPQFTRLRHRYRGVRESWKINLEIQQMVFSVYGLYDRYDAIRAEHSASAELLIEGGPIVGVNDVDNNPLIIEGLNDLISRAAALQVRVKRLER